MFMVNEKIGSKYRFVILCAQRTRQLLDGADVRVESGFKKPAYLAMQEILSDKVEWTVKEAQAPAMPESGEILQVEVGP
jgi:DNA-directed RNA polymerase omega subunit